MKLIVIGPKGKMGSLIAQVAARHEKLELIGAIAPAGRAYIGQDIGQVAKIGQDIGIKVTDNLEAIISTCDVIIDFSTKENAKTVVELAVKYKKALVCGTTGFTTEEFAIFEKASKDIPMLYAANTSKFVNVMHKLLEIVGKTLGEESDIEILEMHDQWKKDVPSGTSKELGNILAEAMGKEINELAVYGRESGENQREPGSIGYHSLRAGNIPSSHTVFIGGMGERLELTHHSYNWECFAIGACDCAAYLEGKRAGFYSIKDVLAI